MKPKIVTHKGTVPVDYRKGRSKPFRLRVTVGGKRIEKYFSSRQEAERAWVKMAPLVATAQFPGVTPPLQPEITPDEVALFLGAKAMLAEAKLSIPEAVRIALEAQQLLDDEVRRTGGAWSLPGLKELGERLTYLTAEVARLASQLETRSELKSSVVRSTAAAAHYCGFARGKDFTLWARRLGMEIPRAKPNPKQRHAFLLEDLDLIIALDPRVCRHRSRKKRIGA